MLLHIACSLVRPILHYSTESAEACDAAAPGLSQSPGASTAVPHCLCRVLLKQSMLHNAYMSKQCIVYRKTKSSGIILGPWATFVPCLHFYYLCCSAWRQMCSFWRFWSVFLRFLLILPQLKSFYPKNLSACIILVLDATFVPNLTFLGLLSPGKNWSPIHPPAQLISRPVKLSTAQRTEE